MIMVLQWLLCRALHESIRRKDQEKSRKALLGILPNIWCTSWKPYSGRCKVRCFNLSSCTEFPESQLSIQFAQNRSPVACAPKRPYAVHCIVNAYQPNWRLFGIRYQHSELSRQKPPLLRSRHLEAKLNQFQLGSTPESSKINSGILSSTWRALKFWMPGGSEFWSVKSESGTQPPRAHWYLQFAQSTSWLSCAPNSPTHHIQ